MTRKHVSIIIPSLYSPRLQQTLASLRVQAFDLTTAEILVVGLDEHPSVMEDDFIRFVSTERPVIQAVARNLGARQAQGDILAFIDADCVALPGWLHTIM